MYMRAASCSAVLTEAMRFSLLVNHHYYIQGLLPPCIHAVPSESESQQKMLLLPAVSTSQRARIIKSWTHIVAVQLLAETEFGLDLDLRFLSAAKQRLINSFLSFSLLKY